MTSFFPEHAPLTAAQLAEHFSAVQAYMRHVVESRAQIEVPLTSAVPGSRATDGWRLRLCCTPEVVGPRVEWVAAYAIDALVDVDEDDLGCEPVWDSGREVIASAVGLPQVTAALASWLLREGWLGSGSELAACDATDCMLTFTAGELLAEQRVRETAIALLPAPHWVRARDRRQAFEARDDAAAIASATHLLSQARERESSESFLRGG